MFGEVMSCWQIQTNSSEIGLTDQKIFTELKFATWLRTVNFMELKY